MDSKAPPTFEIAAPPIVIVAEGDTPSAQSNAKGHLLERFIAKLFASLGCDEPEKSHLNVVGFGYEIDLSTRLLMTKERVIAECKAYSSSLPVQALTSFYGKLSAERLSGETVHGWFICVPGLTSNAGGTARAITDRDERFHLLEAHGIYELAKERAWISPIQVPNSHLSDHGILITPRGLYAIAKGLDASSRLPVAVYVKRPDPAGDEDLALFRQTEYVANLPVVDLATSAAKPPAAQKADVPTLVSVIGSSADFEYQLPAAPQFFVGREKLIDELAENLTKQKAQGTVIVLNAQSGWGKSSLALKIASEAEAAGGSATVFDARTTSGPQYVAASIQAAVAKAVKKGVIDLPAEASFGSLKSAMATLQSSTWRTPARPLVIFYDQFENVFRDERVTREFRDLAFMVREISAPVTIGFSWKTDLVALTENYPYALRDEIRGVASVISVEPFGPKEVGIVLKRLAKQSATKLSTELRERMREYSQGLPWLLKKLASHILDQLKAGTTQEALLGESLNIEELFSKDLARLQPAEIDALKLVAREAPVAVADLVERVDSAVIQTLVDQRLLVRVGEKLDTYWDIFREFLLTNKVAIEDTFILRQRPRSTAKVLAEVMASGGEVSSQDVASKLGTSVNVVFNSARDLRQLGILAPKPGVLMLADSLKSAGLSESALQARVSKSLRRHRVFNTVEALIEASSSGKVTTEDLAAALPSVYPAVSAEKSSWGIYAVAFAQWLEYGGLISLVGSTISKSDGNSSKLRILGSVQRRGRTKTFPQSRPGPVMQYLGQLLGGNATELANGAKVKIVSDLTVLGILGDDGSVRDVSLAHQLIAGDAAKSSLLDLLSQTPGGQAAIDLLQADPASSPEVIGSVIRDAYGHLWADSTTRLAGAKFRAWAAAAGIGPK